MRVAFSLKLEPVWVGGMRINRLVWDYRGV